MTLPIKEFDAGELEITIKNYQELYKQKIFNFWKNHYTKIKQRKANLAYKYVSNSLEAWKAFKDQKKENRRKIKLMNDKINSNLVRIKFFKI
jgi:hypothetical protein